LPRSLVTINDLTNDEIEAIFALADDFLREMPTPGKEWRIGGRISLAEEFVLSTLFYEPSTRTRFSFESAMHRLGGHVISSASRDTTSAAKGESLADTVRVLENYSDVIVLRHPWEGAARVAAEYTDVPVINAGDGSHEHPTQTLCDLYTLRKENESVREKRSFRDLTVLLRGDLKHGRTVHSLVYALARFGAKFIPSPATEDLALPQHVIDRLRREYDCYPASPKDLDEEFLKDVPINAVYVTPDKDKSHQLAWVPEVELSVKVNQIHAFYVTRLQLERADGDSPPTYPKVDSRFLNGSRFRQSSVLHPLPRVEELGYDMDSDSRGVYFKQASYGVPVRMALLAAMLKLRGDILSASPPDANKYEQFDGGGRIECLNGQCVTHLESERRHLKPKFFIVTEDQKHFGGAQPQLTLRCAYCEYEVHPHCLGSKSHRKYDCDPARLSHIRPLSDLVFFNDEQQALEAGYQRYKGTPVHV
jgi:aspartate carbamoyltransferase catalytic subunit